MFFLKIIVKNAFNFIKHGILLIIVCNRISMIVVFYHSIYFHHSCFGVEISFIPKLVVNKVDLLDPAEFSLSIHPIIECFFFAS